MSNGLGQQYLPRPCFSPENPYWIDPRTLPDPQLFTGNSARDFLYATTWEMWRRFDVITARCVRQATIDTVRLNTIFDLRRQIKELKFKEGANDAKSS